MPTHLGNGLDHEITNFVGQHLELAVVETPKISRGVYLLEK